MSKSESFLANRFKSIGFALKGAILLLKKEASIKIQFFIALLLTAFGFYFNISSFEWMVQILTIGLVLSLEGINTTVEEIADFIHPDYHSKIGVIKDIAAGSVFIASLSAIIIGLIIYIPKIF